MLIEDTHFVIRAATGKFSKVQKVYNCFESPIVDAIQRTLKSKKMDLAEKYTIIPLEVGELILGIIYLDQSVYQKDDIELLQIFANQAAVSIQNAKLYEMATIDQLTNVFTRRFFEQWFLRELRISFRIQQPLTLILIDMDNLKNINDQAGHLEGDGALAIMGNILKKATRSTDIVARYGGDEFVILLPQTPLENVHYIIERIFNSLKDKFVKSNEGLIPLQCSIGISGNDIPEFLQHEIPRPIPQEYYEIMLKTMIKKADEMLYKAKKSINKKIEYTEKIQWPSLDMISKKN